MARRMRVTDLSYGVGDVGGRRTVLVKREGIVAAASELPQQADPKLRDLLDRPSLQLPGDDVRIAGSAPDAGGGRVTLGEVTGRIVAPS